MTADRLQASVRGRGLRLGFPQLRRAAGRLALAVVDGRINRTLEVVTSQRLCKSKQQRQHGPMQIMRR